MTLLGGLTPGTIQELYGLDQFSMTAGSNRTVAVVVAFDDPLAEADLAVYRAAFGLPPCTSLSGCFRKLAADGSRNYPSADSSWSVETSTDVDTVSAVCPGCNLLVVEAASANIPDLAAAVDEAAASGATVISNSYGVTEAADNVAYDSHYHHVGIPIVVAAGDNGYGVTFPASSEYVTAVGGTSFYQAGAGVSEVAWSQTNSGCSAFIPKPSWQKDKQCQYRTMNDVAMIADPATGMAVYDSTLNGSTGGWAVIGGTSIGAPMFSALIALSSEPSAFDGAGQFYKNGHSFYSITAGSNGVCSITYLCTAGKGYSGPVGIGSPNGDSSFNT